MIKAHLDALALVTRLAERLRLHQSACPVLGILVDISRDLSCELPGTAARFDRTEVAIELGGAIEERLSVMNGAAGVRHFVVGADVNASPPVPTEIRAWQGAVPSGAFVPDRDVRSDAGAEQPPEELARAVGRISSKAFGFEPEALIGPLDHVLSCSNFVVVARRCCLHIDDRRVLDVDEIIEPIAGLHPLVALTGQAAQGSLVEIAFGGLQSGFGSDPASSAATYSFTARVWRSGSAQTISSGALP
ncbi:MAG: hypothetical protein WAM77_22340 [Xanthobacteraceae bacterium]